MTEREKEITVQAELPGMDENDVHVSLADGVLRIALPKTQVRRIAVKTG